MDETLKALGHLLVQSIPTILFFILLTVYLDRIFFKPMARILQRRREATEGVRELARKAFEAAEKKGSELEHALAIARSQLHQEHEAVRQRWADEQAQAIANARAEADRSIQAARQQIAAEVEHAQTGIAAQVEDLSRRIAENVLTRRVA